MAVSQLATIMVVTDGDIEPIHRTLISISLLAGRRCPEVLLTLTKPIEARELLDCLEVWSSRYDLRIRLAIPYQSLPPFVALRSALTEAEVDGYVVILPAGTIPKSVDFALALTPGADRESKSHDLLIAPSAGEDNLLPTGTCWVLSPPGLVHLLKLDLAFGAIEAAAEALKLRLTKAGLSWHVDDRLRVVSEPKVWDHIVPRIDFLMLADSGFSDPQQESVQGGRTQARPRRARSAQPHIKVPLHLVSETRERERGERL
ncbi:hypothetical protein D3874_04875 [Oleomonas cavernae]|uniref:Uncharacterized protein n=1 Tax=Oleomonas cavernae TaxID=2320859 RepID=A0A418W8U0_9PROT|nr:hypothetical protein D3874_04875 [Oleomonas cavernae]